jgi:HSP20 family protein
MARARQKSLDDRHPLDGAQTVRTSQAHSSRTRSFGSAAEEGRIMSIVRWDPFRELEDMSYRLNRLFNRADLVAPQTKETLAGAEWSPAVDIVETPEEFLVKAECPAVNKEDIKVSVEQGTLRISGERKQEKEEKTRKYHRVERTFGSFVRTFALPDNVDQAKVKAEFKDGLLNVHLPKSEKGQPRAVDVKIS